MTNIDKNISVGDITFDDVLDGAIEDPVLAEDVQEEQVKTNEDVKEDTSKAEETSLDDDAKAKEEEDSDETGEIKVKTETNFAKKVSEKPVQKTDDEEVEEEKDDSVVGQILSTLGYEVDEKYEDTTEGLISLTKDMGSQIAEERLKELFDQHPLVGQHLNYVLNGGQSQDFMAANDPRSDFSKMEIGDEDVQAQKYVLSEYFKMKGHDDNFIKELLEDYQDNGKLKSKADIAKESLVKAQEDYKVQMVKQQQEQQKQYYAEQKKFWDGVYTTIDESKEFKGITIPEREKNKFFDYLSKPVTKEGYTQRDVDHSEADMDVKLAIDYLMYKGFKLDKLIDKKARTKSTQRLKDKIKGHQESVKSARKTPRNPSTSVDIDDLNLNLF